MSRHPDHAPDTRDPRHLLANDDHLSALQSAQAVAAAKVAAFEQGASNQRKSKRELEKERERLKAVEEEELAAKAYEDFVRSFGEEEEGAGPAAAGRSVRTMGKGFVRAGGGEGYNPLKEREKLVQQQPQQPTIPTGPKAMRPTAAALLDDDEPTEATAKANVPFGRKKRDMDNFLEELKRDQKVREDRLKHQAGRVGSSVTALAAREHAPVLTGSYDSGDPLTTNIHVAGLPQHVTEQSLGMFFAQYGPVGSVKIMWPRADSIPVGGRRLLGGFVAFLRRPDAEKAAKELDGAEWGGNILRTGWGKAVPLPARPIYEIEGASSRSDRDRERRPHHGRSSSRDRDRSCRYSSSGSRSRSRSPPRRQWPELEAGVDDKFLRSVSARVREHGSGFEEMIRVKERENPKFGFLFDEKLPSYHYFKMLLDSRYRPPSTVSFVDEGNADIYSSDSAEDSERERTPKGRLGKLAQKRFESMLRSLTSTREKIGRSMAFALEHADAASLIVDLLVASLTLDGTPVPRKIARLHLVSDILHNSSASLPNAWVYRSIFENRLPEVFDHLGDVYLSFPGRMKAEQFRNQVVDIVDVWERDWILFEPSVIEDFRQRLSGVSAATEGDPSLDAEMASLPPSTLDASAPSFAPSFAPAEPEPAVPVPAPEAPPAKRGFKIGGFKTTFQPSALDAQLPDEAEDVDGAPVEDVDGAPVEDVDGEEVDVDGEAVDVDGEVLLEDVDGAPVVQEKGKTETVVIEDDEAMDLAQSDDDIF